MTLTVEAIYENGTLKLAEPLPLREHERSRSPSRAKPVRWWRPTASWAFEGQPKRPSTLPCPLSWIPRRIDDF